MLAVRTEDNKIFKQISTPCFEDRVIADGGTVSTLDYTDKVLNEVAAIGVQPSLVMVPSGIKDSKLYSQIPYGGGADFTVTRAGTTGMRLTSTGYWQPVAANTPRVDLTWNAATQMFEEWLNIEQATTNLIARARSFAHSDWTKSGASIQGDPSTAGAEKVTNGGFDTDTTWNKGSSWTISSGSANYDAITNANPIYQNIGLTSGKMYKLTFNISTASTARMLITNYAVTNYVALASYTTGTYTFYFQAVTDGYINFYAYNSSGGGTFSIDNVSIKEVTGFACPFVTSAGVNTYEGYKLVEGTNNGIHVIVQTESIPISSSSNYTFTFSAQPAGRTMVKHYEGMAGGSAMGCIFILEGNGSTTSNGASVVSSSCILQSNGYYKCSITYTSTGGQVSQKNSLRLVSTGTTDSYLGDGTSGIYICHAQLEAGAVATSPVYGAETATQTRNADVIVKTGASALIGQTEGYVVFEIINTLRTYESAYLFRLYANADNEIFIRKEAGATTYTARWRGSASNIYTKTSLSVLNGVNKIAIAWKSGGSATALNGTVFTDTGIGAFNVSIDQISIGNANSFSLFNDHIKLIDMGKTRISNAQLAALTTL